MKDETISTEQMALSEVVSYLQAKDVERFYELVDGNSKLDDIRAQELARILQPIYERSGDEMEVGDNTSAFDVSTLVDLWKKLLNGGSGFDDPGEGGFARDDNLTIEDSNTPSAAGLLQWLDPRNSFRLATVLLMKDRAGSVGAHGVGPMVSGLLTGQARIHLMGHSYGCKVMLSALCYPTHPRQITSLLLLQPATSYLCFAEDADGKGHPGGYRKAFELVEQPIVSTFSNKDAPLTKFFHLAVRRDLDLGEQKIAGIPPSKFAALGGFGPGGTRDGESKTLIMQKKPVKYNFSEPSIRIYGLDGSDNKINGHGDVANSFTQWALMNLVFGNDLL